MAIDKSKFIEQFKAETAEHIQKLNQGLLKLEKKPEKNELLEPLMKEAHTIKGSAMMMGYKRIAEIAGRMEDGLQTALDKKIIMEKTHYNLLFKCLDSIEFLLKDVNKVTLEAKGIDEPYFEKICKEAASFNIHFTL